MDVVRIAIEKAGGPASVARLLGTSVQAVCFYRDGKRAFPVEHAAKLEEANGVIRRWDLFPATWHRIWPELIGAAGAPAIETEVRDAA